MEFRGPLREIVYRLQVLHRTVETYRDGDPLQVSPERGEELVERYDHCTRDASEIDASLESVFLSCVHRTATNYWTDEELPDHTSPDCLADLQKCIEDAISSIKVRWIATQETGTNDPGKLQHLFASGSQFDALQEVTNLIQAASETLWLVDTYINRDTLGILRAKQAAVSVRILTKKPIEKDAEALRPHLLKFQQQCGPIEVRTTSALHDRFLVIDGSKCVHIGHSIKDLGNKVCMCSTITDPGMVTAVLDVLEKHWVDSEAVCFE